MQGSVERSEHTTILDQKKQRVILLNSVGKLSATPSVDGAYLAPWGSRVLSGELLCVCYLKTHTHAFLIRARIRGVKSALYSLT